MAQAPVFVTPNGAVAIVLYVPIDGNRNHRRSLPQPVTCAKQDMLEKNVKIVPKDILAKIAQFARLDGGHGSIHLYCSVNPFLPTTIVTFATSACPTILVTIVHDVPTAMTYPR